ncbi:MAG: gntR [Enterovirga sp.]|nr:gntR [Enterovirga sp.]
MAGKFGSGRGFRAAELGANWIRFTPDGSRFRPMNAQQSAYGYLKERITSGEFPANAPLRPEQIGKALGISRMPVREAILQLEAEGFVTIGSNRRAIVTSRTPADIVELFEIRIALEGLAAERAAPRLNATHVSGLGQILKEMARASEDPRRWIGLHDQFHDELYEVAGMPRLLGEIRRLRHSTQPYILMYISLFTVPEMPGSEHGALLDVIRQGSPDAARTAMADHIRDAACGVVYHLLRGEAAGAEPRLQRRTSVRARERSR